MTCYIYFSDEGMMITSFRHKGLKRLYERSDRKGVNAQHAERIENILGLLDTAAAIEDMNVPTFRLHPLTGDLKGFWSVTVRANWRIVFRFEDGNAFDVDLTDYH
jgi:toxin HigB-1